ncbi:uncharacterized protein LOC133322268, partial [Musca vetustissima]|uniref:uncharacterized protein LOC133322268 n=1 Tax=Musca vetustissima TaxID=27455 RepID=UPI002AB6FB2D
MSNNWITLMLFGLLTSQITGALNIAKVTTTTTTATEKSQLVEDVRPGATPSSSVPLDVKGKRIENDLHFTTITSHDSVEAKPFISSSSTEASIPSTPLENRFAETQTPTLASSNAPATTIVNESEKPTTTTITLEKLTPTIDQPSEIAAERMEATNKESLESSDASVVDGVKDQQQIMTMTGQQTIINNKELQQQTEQQHESHKEQQTLTTEVSMLKETEVQQQQVNGNAQTTTANTPNNVITLKATATDNKGEVDEERVEKKPKHEDMKKFVTTNIPFTTIHAAEDATEIATDSQQFKIDTSISGNFQATSIPQQQQGILNGDISSSSSTNLDEESRRILSSNSVDLDEKKSEPSSNTTDLNKDSRRSPSSSTANSDEKTGSPTSNWEILDEKQRSSNLEILDVQTSNPTSTSSSSSSPSPGIEENEKLHIFEEDSTSRPQPTHTSSTTSHADDDMKSSSPISPPSTGIEESEKLHIFEEAITSRPLPPHPDNHEFATNSEQLALNDFKPLIQETNNKLLAERTIFTPKNLNEEQEWKQNLMPNEVEDFEHPVGPKLRMEPKKVYQSPYEHNINWSPYLHPATPVAVDFTGKVLQEEDGVITEIEEKFRLKEFATDINGKQEENEETTTAKAAEPVATPTHKPFATLMVNHEKSPPNTHRSREVSTAAGGPTPNVVIMRPVQFIERRVKKSFDFPMHRIASDANHAMQHFDFANTKFSSNLNEPKQHLNPPLAQELSATSGVGAGISQGAPGHDLNAMHVPRQQPEFSTTKFYNSKELYNEMLQHKNKQMQQQQQQQSESHSHPDSMNLLKEDDITPQAGRGASSMTLNSFAVLHSPKIAKLEEIHEQPQKSLAIKRVTVQQHQHNKSDSLDTPPTTMSTNIGSTTTRINAELLTATTTSTTTKKFHKELKKAKLLIKTIIPNNNNNNNGEGDGSQRTETYKSSTVTPDHKTNTDTAAQSASPTTTSTQLLTTNPTTLTSSKPQEARSNNLTSSALPSAAGDAASSQILAPSSTSGKSYSSTSSAPPPASSSDPQSYMVPSYVYPPPTWRPTSSVSSHSTNPTKSATKPIVRPRILSRLQEKINSLECEIPNVPQDSHLWRGNETHELLLPIMTPENCKTDKDCTAMMVSWEGEAEIQSGDILIVEINDALLNPKEINLTT